MADRAWYGDTIETFIGANADEVVGQLVRNSEFSVDPSQRNAWIEEIEVLKTQLKGLSGSIFLEFNIPRMGRRIDAVVISGPIVFVIEFKVGEKEVHRKAIEQVWDYALDLKYFHEASHQALLVPVLVVTHADELPFPNIEKDPDGVFRPISVHAGGLRQVLNQALGQLIGTRVEPTAWANASYRPTPTIFEAARALYRNHSVEAIARYDAGAKNLRLTSERLERLLDEARECKRKIICFVTGVPGAGKTLVGLNIATRRWQESDPTHAVFLSGNGPLVKVLREALTRDEFARKKKEGQQVRKGKVGESVKAFIQNVHHFRDDALEDTSPPADRVAIFDEAQRAWNLGKTADFMRRKKRRPGFDQSEPEFLISCLDRHSDWAAVICLVGGGQEINTGEAGIEEWIHALKTKFTHWEMYLSPRLNDSEYVAGNLLSLVAGRPNTHFDEALHLSVALRSFRAESVSAFVKALLDCDEVGARSEFTRISANYPIVITRDLHQAKQWIRKQARGSERYGLVASSKAQRLKPHAVDIRVEIDPVHWFLNDRDDLRSSYYLEDAATEFQVQGLELDWTCVTWDGDLRHTGSGWGFYDFRGSRWQHVRSEENKRFLKNAYRVLLTRARQGMVIFIPPGDTNDQTRLPGFYDSTFQFMRRLGLPEVQHC